MCFTRIGGIVINREKELLELLKRIKISNQEIVDKISEIEVLVEAKQARSSQDYNEDIVRRRMKFNSGLILPEIGISRKTRELFNENNRIIERSKGKQGLNLFKW